LEKSQTYIKNGNDALITAFCIAPVCKRIEFVSKTTIVIVNDVAASETDANTVIKENVD
jgi:hypothetical protein